MNDAIRLELQDGIAVITFDRPEELNTFTQPMIDGLGEAYRRCDDDDEVRVVVVTGAGKAFCAGADMSAGAGTFAGEQMELGSSSCPLSFQAWDLRKPVIAACNGHAIGVGLSLALQADLRVFAIEGRYGLLQNRRGVVADFAAAHVLPRLVGFERAFELLVRADRLSGAEAAEWGLAGRVVPAQQVLETAMEIAADMAANCAPLVMALHKRMLWRSHELTREAMIELETRALRYSMRQPDAEEGGRAWFERRPPQWRGRGDRDWPEFLQ